MSTGSKAPRPKWHRFSGSSIVACLVLMHLMASGVAAGEQRLFFAPIRVAELQSAIESPPVSDLFASVKRRAQSLVGSQPDGLNALDLATGAADLVFTYWMTGNAAFGEQASALLAEASKAKPLFELPGGTPGQWWQWARALKFQSLALAWLEPSGIMSSTEQAAARAALADRSRLTYKQLQLPDRSPKGTALIVNFRLRNLSALGISALVLSKAPAFAEESAEWLEYVMHDLLGDKELPGVPPGGTMNSVLTSDGTYKEGASYLYDSFSAFLPFVYAYRETTGEDPFTERFVHPALDWEYKTQMPDGTQATVDTGWIYGGRLQNWAAPLLPDAGTHMWAWERAGSPQGYDLLSAILHDSSIAAEPPTEQVTSFFPEGGYAVMRSGWEPDATYLLLLAEHEPSRSAHEQPDQSSFILQSKGAYLAIDPGDGRNYPDSRHYWVRSAAAHNLVLVDGVGPEVVWDAVNVKDPAYFQNTLSTPFVDSAQLQLTYGAVGVDQRRTVLFPNKRYFVIVDQLAGRTRHNYAWQLHFGAASTGTLTLNNTAANWRTSTWSGPDVNLRADFVAPQNVQLAALTGSTNFIPGRTFAHSYMQAVSSGKTASYLTVLQPTTSDEQPGRVQRLDARGGSAGEVLSKDRRDLILVGDQDGAAAEGVAIDKGIALFSTPVDRPLFEEGSWIILHGVSWLRYRDTLVIKADKPIAAALNFSQEGVTGSVEPWLDLGEGEWSQRSAALNQPVHLRVKTAGQKVEAVRFNGEKIPYQVKEVEGYLETTLPSAGEIDIRWATP